MAGFVDINELYITPDGKSMIIDVSVKEKSYYKDIYLDEIVIDTQDTFVETGISPEWILKRKIYGEDYIAKVAWETGKVDEYMDIICTLRSKHCCHNHCHDHCGHGCGCHDHCNTCQCRTGETGTYSNPFTIKSIDLTEKKAVDGNDVVFDIEEGCYYKWLNSQEVQITSTKSVQVDKDDIYMYNGKDITLYVQDTIPLNVKHARIELKQEDFCQPLADTMFFVYVKCRGTEPGKAPIPTMDCPCNQQDELTLGVCVNEFLIYRRFMCLMRELLNDCEIPKEFIDLYLRWESVKMCIATGHYSEAILYWKRFFLFHNQRPLWERPHYNRYWDKIHDNMFLPEALYPNRRYGWGGSLSLGGCRRCRR